MNELWIIEARNPDGSLNLTLPQPHDYFGLGAIRGMTEDAIAKAIFRRFPSAKSGSDTPIPLHGTNIGEWPKNIDPRFIARRKTW